MALWFEWAYNRYVADTDKRFLCLDRKLVKTCIHPQGFEICDLLGPGQRAGACEEGQ